ncbi:MAG: hypothetical protein WHT22_02405 [Bacteroidales bacterium]|jgi:hypothetical protein|nr:hypothetical protein [Bacteroidales bacterium]
MATQTKIITHILNALQIDLIAIGIIYFMPEIVSATSLPIYLCEPMRILTLIGLAHTGKENALILAIGLPLLGYLTGGHPHEIKSGIMAIELIINILLFYAIRSHLPIILAMPLAIISSKLVYYGLKWAAVSASLIEAPIIATPISFQIGVLVASTLYVWWYLKK